MTGVQLVPITSEPGVSPVTYQGKTYELDAPPDGTGPVTATSVLLPAGRYILAVARTARVTPPLGDTPPSDAYRLTVASSPLPPSGDIEPNDDTQQASLVTGAFEASGDLAGSPDVIAWRLSAEDASHSWDLALSSPPGSGMTLTVVDPTAQPLATAMADATGLAQLHDFDFPAGLGPGGARRQPRRVHPAGDRRRRTPGGRGAERHPIRGHPTRTRHDGHGAAGRPQRPGPLSADCGWYARRQAARRPAHLAGRSGPQGLHPHGPDGRDTVTRSAAVRRGRPRDGGAARPPAARWRLPHRHHR